VTRSADNLHPVAVSHPIIAVVEDEPAVRAMLQRALRLAGYHAETFATGHEFLSSIAHRRPDCVILDVHMPGMSGLDVERQLSGLQLHLPVIFITASDEVSIDGCTDPATTVGVLRKPFPSEALFEAVEAALRINAQRT
jgi:FixJ family two-component response regulator